MPVGRRKQPSAAKAVKPADIYGTAEAVPFVRQSLPQPLRVSEVNQPKSNWDKSDFVTWMACALVGSVLESVARLNQHGAVPNLQLTSR